MKELTILEAVALSREGEFSGSLGAFKSRVKQLLENISEECAIWVGGDFFETSMFLHQLELAKIPVADRRALGVASRLQNGGDLGRFLLLSFQGYVELAGLASEGALLGRLRRTRGTGYAVQISSCSDETISAVFNRRGRFALERRWGRHES